MDTNEDARPDDDGDAFYTRTITLKNGRKLHASAYGLKAFRCTRRKRPPKG